MIRAEVLGLDFTMKNLQMLEREGVRSMALMIKGTTIQAARSAELLTPPGKTKKGKRANDMQDKYLFRKTKKINKKLTGGRMFWANKKNQIFATTKNIKPKDRKAKGVQIIKEGIEFWDKKKKRFAIAPINPKTGKTHLRTGRRIPGAGAAKSGWKQALAKAGVITGQWSPHVRSGNLGTGKITNWRGLLTNNVSYVNKIASSVPREAEQRAWRWLLGNLWLKEKKRLKAIKL